MDYINRLDNYDGPEIAKVALKDEYKLYEEAFTVYKKIKMNKDAINVLLENLDDIDRASDFADKIQEKEVYSVLGNAYLKKE